MRGSFRICQIKLKEYERTCDLYALEPTSRSKAMAPHKAYTTFNSLVIM